MINSMHKASFVPQDMGVIARKMCICADPLAISILIYVLSFQRPPRTVGNGVGQGGQVIHGLHRLTPVCLRLTYIPVSKVIMDGGWNGIIYLVGHLCRASSRAVWKCLCVKEVEAANGEALEGQDPAGLGTTGVEAVDWVWTLAGPMIS